MFCLRELFLIGAMSYYCLTSLSVAKQNPSGTHQPEIKKITVKGVSFELVRIPAGEFVMGSESGVESEKPAHRVQVESFEMGKTEVTVRQFRRFVEATGYQTNAEKGDKRGNGIFIRRWSPNPGDRDWNFKPDGSWRNPGFVQSEDDPVVGVSWNDAVAFCQWLSKESGEQFRLPSEAEWEYAARAGAKGTALIDNFDEIAWHASNSEGRTHPVGLKKPNTWGLYDILGNGWEWVADVYHSSYQNAPADGSAWMTIDPNDPMERVRGGETRILRGGAWGLNDNTYTSRPFFHQILRCNNSGFRIARSGRVKESDKLPPL
jgi:formylglycine-generating enzyme required for sulfatase activity